MLINYNINLNNKMILFHNNNNQYNHIECQKQQAIILNMVYQVQMKICRRSLANKLLKVLNMTEKEQTKITFKLLKLMKPLKNKDTIYTLLKILMNMNSN